MLRALCIAAGLVIPGAAFACEAEWRFVQAALGTAGLTLSDAPENMGGVAGTACRVSAPELRVRGRTRLTARSVAWRVAPRKPLGQTILVDVELRGLTLNAGPDDEMAAYVSKVFGLERPGDLSLTLTWSDPTGRIELRTRGTSPRPSIWLDAVLSGVGQPRVDSWWSGFETAKVDQVAARLRGDGLAERTLLALMALDRLRGEGAPEPRLQGLRNVIEADITRLPTAVVDPVSRAALADALADTPGGRGVLDATLRWSDPLSAAGAAMGLMTGRSVGQPQVTLAYER